MTAAELPAGARLTREDLRAALSVFLLVFVSTLPVVIPFLFIDETRPALRVSNAVAIVLLYMLGHSLAPYTGHRPWLLGLSMVGVGVVLVGVTLALGG